MRVAFSGGQDNYCYILIQRALFRELRGPKGNMPQIVPGKDSKP
jgi:hypothetical protein